MNALFRLAIANKYNLSIIGLEKDGGFYISEDYTIKPGVRDYKYSETVILNRVISSSAAGVEEVIGDYIIDNTTASVDKINIPLIKDGIYIVQRVIIPTQTWYNNINATFPELIANYADIFIYDTTKSGYFKLNKTNQIFEKATIEQILASNPPADIAAPTTTAVKVVMDTFVMEYLNSCFNDICKSLLMTLPLKCKRSDFHNKIYSRDILWMAINVIKYNLSLSKLFEAQRILEEVIYCGNLCNNQTNNSTNCGCNN